MKKYIKRNQILITALAVMIAVAGYLSFREKRSVDKNASMTAEVLDDDSYVLDLGTGTGILPLLLSSLTEEYSNFIQA